MNLWNYCSCYSSDLNHSKVGKQHFLNEEKSHILLRCLQLYAELDEHMSVLHEEQNTGPQTLFDKKKLDVEL